MNTELSEMLALILVAALCMRPHTMRLDRQQEKNATVSAMKRDRAWSLRLMSVAVRDRFD